MGRKLAKLQRAVERRRDATLDVGLSRQFGDLTPGQEHELSGWLIDLDARVIDAAMAYVASLRPKKTRKR